MVRAGLVCGQIALADALAHPALHGLEVAHVIQWLEGWGPVNTTRLLADVQPFPISPNRRCGDLTIRQCRLLGDLVGR